MRALRLPLAGVLSGVVLVGAALVGWANADPTAVPSAIGPGAATVLATDPPSVQKVPGEPSAGISTATSAASRTAPSATPVRVRIPSLTVNAQVLTVGVDQQGAIDPPSDGQQLGWYRYGPVPGAARGSVVVVGHVNDAQGGPGALFPLRKISAGAVVKVTTSDGRIWTYQVVGRQAYEKVSVPLGAIFSTGGAPRLTLITCGGAWDPVKRHYQDNVVVTAKLA
ncbi:MAG: class F sortase [Allobranchiibius sp.]